VSDVADRIATIPRPEEPIPTFPPTLALFATGIATFAGSSYLGVTGAWPWPLSTLFNSIAAVLLHTVAHEASHAAASSSETLNRWVGRIATPFFTVFGSYKVFRFLHMQHHRFTNVPESDPDHYEREMARWRLPLHWITAGASYVDFYLARSDERPRAEKLEHVLTVAIVAGVLAVAVATGHGLAALAFFVVPARIATFLIAWAFDWMPHHGLRDTPATNRFHTTRNRVGLERLLTPVMLYQNYHLVHHLHPVIPFYRYIAVWRGAESAYLAHDPPLVDPRGRPLSTEEYRRLRAIDAHH
jgi:fatty acid desaturase